MPKKLYKCEVCGKNNNSKQVVCCKCVEKDLLRIEERLRKLEQVEIKRKFVKDWKRTTN